jgi:hypothetical protein
MHVPHYPRTLHTWARLVCVEWRIWKMERMG